MGVPVSSAPPGKSKDFHGPPKKSQQFPGLPAKSQDVPGPRQCWGFLWRLWLSAKQLAYPRQALGPGVTTLAAIAWVDAGGIVHRVADQAGKVKL